MLPPGSTSGQRGSVSFSRKPVAAAGEPPSADTRNNPAPGTTCPGADGAKMIVPSASQLAPNAPVMTVQMVNGAPPANETLFNFPFATNPIHCPSGEKNGFSVPAVPASDLLSN